MSRAALIEEIQILEEMERRKKMNALRIIYDNRYSWQFNFIEATLAYYEACMCAANQIGKSETGLIMDAYHLIGDYPDDYPGHKFDHPPLCWCLGYSMEKTRDLLQNRLFGNFTPGTGFEGGLVPKDRIVSWESATGVANAMRTVRVKHRSGGTSVMQFWSYSQGQHAIMGDIVDWVHVDEEPRDQTIRPQLITRTANGDKSRGGRIIYTLTPENGRTELIIQFMDTPSQSQFFMMKGWDDAPHMTVEKRERLLESYPDYQRDMRSKGIPMLGHGRIYDLADEFVVCDPFPIPEFWKTLIGMDFGWDHPQAFAKLVVDPDNDIVYITNSWRKPKVSANDAWGATQSWTRSVPVAWPADGLVHEKGRDVTSQQKDHYHLAGFNMLSSHATWPDGSVSVEHGVYSLLDRMRKGTLRIFRGQQDLMQEIRQYHRDENQRIVKVMDDLVDAVRYAYMMRRFAKVIAEVGVAPKIVRPRPITPIGRRR